MSGPRWSHDAAVRAADRVRLQAVMEGCRCEQLVVAVLDLDEEAGTCRVEVIHDDDCALMLAHGGKRWHRGRSDQ